MEETNRFKPETTTLIRQMEDAERAESAANALIDPLASAEVQALHRNNNRLRRESALEKLRREGKDRRSKEKDKQILILEKQNMYDALTEAYSRLFALGGVNEQQLGELNRMRQRANREGEHMCIVLVDINKLKIINDTYGHGAGDGALRQIVTILKSFCRATDIVARLGGDEFLIILPNITRDVLIQRINGILASNQFSFEYNGQSIPLQASFGVFEIGPDNSEPQKAIIAKADKAMYRAKKLQQGVSAVVGYEEEADSECDELVT